MVGQGKFYDYEDITLVRAGDDLRIQRKGSASLTGEVKSFFTGVDEIKITVNGERFSIAKPARAPHEIKSRIRDYTMKLGVSIVAAFS